MSWSREVDKPHLLTFMCSACIVAVKSWAIACFFFWSVYFIIFLFFHQLITSNAQCGAPHLLSRRAHPAHFKECEKWVQKSNLTKGSLESMGEASLCKGVNVFSRRRIVHFCFLGIYFVVLDSRQGENDRRGEAKTWCHVNPIMHQLQKFEAQHPAWRWPMSGPAYLKRFVPKQDILEEMQSPHKSNW